MKTTTKDTLNSIVERFIAKMENGDNGSWLQPWTNGLPMNYSSKTEYNGFNVFSLAMEADDKGYKYPYWLTFNQVKKLGGSVKKGSKSYPVFFYKMVETKELTDKGEAKFMPILRVYNVFNVDQCEGIEIEEAEQGNTVAHLSITEFTANVGAVVKRSSDGAYYRPSTDCIYMPDEKLFEDADSHAATLAHELTHWTGGAKRLDRLSFKKWGDEKYAFEELVAELGSCLICSELNIPIKEPRHTAYLASWIKALKEHPQILWIASKKSFEAYKLLMDAQIAESEKAA